jgi:hypothetical protein
MRRPKASAVIRCGPYIRMAGFALVPQYPQLILDNALRRPNPATAGARLSTSSHIVLSTGREVKGILPASLGSAHECRMPPPEPAGNPLRPGTFRNRL